MFQFTFQFAQALSLAGHRVHLITGPRPELVSSSPNLKVVEALPTWHPNADLGSPSLRRKVRRVGRALLLAESWRRVLKYVRENRPDIIQFGDLRYALDTSSLLVVAKYGGAKAVVDVAHNPLPYDVTSRTRAVEKSGRLSRALLSRAYRACDLVLVLGEGPKAELMGAFPDVKRAVVCGHGDYSAVLTSHNVPAPSTVPPRLLFFGSWTKYKNIPLMLDAFEMVRATHPEARLTIAGPVMPDVDENHITERADRIGNVDLKPGYIAMNDLPELFGSHRALVYSYATVNISGSIHMAYTFGRPVLATDVGSMRDAVEDGVTGLITASDPSSIAEAMLRILRDDDLADRMGENAGRHARDASSWAGVAERAVAGYMDVLPSEP
ncbi:glycosyltransferase family 4 protein [Kocuria rosea]|uniref:glycosyltransferase family 4 protein n=1 Tax=Kocuria rosea TaxID=1275 RepID=UPI001386A4C4|nr:glycosyltransferase family 4 protein [Kocuria rosea]MEB2528883.1 glycosyltransferase family 4 protein [Kocuria rosea]MEB2618788.1 glycosyltransferase family 4 protein [Kocuria rosea]